MSFFLCRSFVICYNLGVIGVGAPSIDFVGKVPEDMLKLLPGRKGDSILVNKEQLQEVFSAFSSESSRVFTGGCCANTIKGLASLNVDVAFCGKIGRDPYSDYFRSVVAKLGVKCHFFPSDQPIQQIVVLVTPDGQRTCYYFLGAAGELAPSDLCREDFEGQKLVYIEGYALYRPGVVEQAIAYAEDAGAKVAIGLNSISVVEAFRSEILHLLKKIGVLFCNQEEARGLTGLLPQQAAEFVSGFCEVAVVTVGREGCWVGSSGKTFLYSGYSQIAVDTTGAGDLFASGFLYGYLQGQPLSVCADWGNRAGSAVVQHMGAELPPDAWRRLKAQLKA